MHLAEQTPQEVPPADIENVEVRRYSIRITMLKKQINQKATTFLTKLCITAMKDGEGWLTYGELLLGPPMSGAASHHSSFDKAEKVGNRART